MCLFSLLGVRDYHKTVLKYVEVNGHKLVTSSRVTLNKNNISEVQKFLLTSYRTSDEERNPYAAIRSHSGKFYSIMHKGIQKFSKELNGCYVGTISPNNKIVIMPWALSEIPGGSMNAEKLVAYIIQIISQVKPVEASAYEIAPKKYSQ